MSTEGPYFGLNLIVDKIKVSSLTVVPSIGEIDVLSRRVFSSGNGDMVWLLMEEIPSHPYLLLIALADHFRIQSRSAVSYAVSCVSKDSTGHID